MKLLVYLIIGLYSLQITLAQNSPTIIEMTPSNWNIPNDALFEKFDNRKTLVLKNGRATVKNKNFINGSIEVDVYAKSIRSFAGISFREQDDNLEEVYMRFHKSNQADAVQYTPMFNNESNWQLYREYQANAAFKNKGWNSLRIDVNNLKAEVFVNNIKVLAVDKLRTDQEGGIIGLWALFGNRFSKFRVTNKAITEKHSIPTQTLLGNTNIIKCWRITKAYPYKENKIQFQNFSKEKYTTVSTEESGLLPISKYVKKTSSGNFEQNKENYIIAATTIHSDKQKAQLFSFDYSDKVLVFLNGELLFSGNNAFRQKGVQYMGHMDINTNKLYLPLKKGENKIHCVVIDKANGWGLIAKLE
ncbi:family 16 glycoside hydrolase [Tenacibaculum sp. SDUM215027]|uniref:family 16 glycoside hydrolase n=1 Tax=Tenacibaculum sp. SDUM215027 TaxID=3422596 RepID=UPI003D30FB5B